MNRVYEIVKPVGIISAAGAVSGVERDAARGLCEFDRVFEDPLCGASDWEGAESELQRAALNAALSKANLEPRDLNLVCAGDLTNQCSVSAFGLKDFSAPFLGLYGACATCAEGLITAALSGITPAAAVTSSHFCSAERQYRKPLDYGATRPPSAQRTVTGAGTFIVAGGQLTVDGCFLSHVLIGKIVDFGIVDADNMGAAMAPAAFDTIRAYISERGIDFDLCVTGDLGRVGLSLLKELLRREGLRVPLEDCGDVLFPAALSGGSGCGCSAVMLASHYLPRLSSGEIDSLIFCGTGALLSPSSSARGLSIPSICHLVRIERHGVS